MIIHARLHITLTKRKRNIPYILPCTRSSDVELVQKDELRKRSWGNTKTIHSALTSISPVECDLMMECTLRLKGYTFSTFYVLRWFNLSLNYQG